MTHTTFVILYIVMNIILLYFLFSAGKKMMKAIKSREKQWIIISVIQFIILLCVFVWHICAYYHKL